MSDLDKINVGEAVAAWLLHRFGPDSPEGREAKVLLAWASTLRPAGTEAAGREELSEHAVAEACAAFSRMQGRAIQPVNQTWSQFVAAMRAALKAAALATPAPLAQEDGHGAADHGIEQASKQVFVPCDCGCGRSCCANCGNDVGFVQELAQGSEDGEARCPKCGCSGIHACSGQPARAWTEQEKADCLAAMQLIRDREDAFLREALTRLQEAVADRVGSTVMLTKADACAIGDALIRRMSATPASPVPREVDGLWLPSAAEWLDGSQAEANSDWRAGWDACRNRAHTLRATPAASGTGGGVEEAYRAALHHADTWIAAAPHGDNCFVSHHYEGDPGSQCNCGREAVLDAIMHALNKDPDYIDACAALPAPDAASQTGEGTDG